VEGVGGLGACRQPAEDHPRRQDRCHVAGAGCGVREHLGRPAHERPRLQLRF
jgi:hypothetical protein